MTAHVTENLYQQVSLLVSCESVFVDFSHPARDPRRVKDKFFLQAAGNSGMLLFPLQAPEDQRGRRVCCPLLLKVQPSHCAEWGSSTLKEISGTHQVP